MEEPNKVKPNTSSTPSIPSAPAVETFTEDMVQVIEDDKGGLIKKIIKEQEAKEGEQKNLSPESRRNRVFVLLGLIFILLAVSLLAFLFFKQASQTIPLVTSPTTSQTPIIFTDKTVTEDVTGLDTDAIIQKIATEVTSSNIKVGGIEAITLSENGNAVGLRRFIELIKSSFDPSDLDLVSDNFLMGVVGGQTQNSFFVLVKMRSFVDIFPLLSHWESTMYSDLHDVFGANPALSVSDLPKKAFQDGIVENKNARILYDDNGNIALIYVFADDQSVILANNTDAVKQIMLRLSGNEIVQ